MYSRVRKDLTFNLGIQIFNFGHLSKINYLGLYKNEKKVQAVFWDWQIIEQ